MIGVNKDTRSWLEIVERIDLKAGGIGVCIDPKQIAIIMDSDPETLTQSAMSIKSPFQIRKRGVETNLISADNQRARDETLISNIAKVHHWFEQIKSGKTFSQIAAEDQTSKRRIQQMIDLAFLAPDIIRDVTDGNQPLGFTSDWCLRHFIPSSWAEQRALIATL